MIDKNKEIMKEWICIFFLVFIVISSVVISAFLLFLLKEIILQGLK